MNEKEQNKINKIIEQVKKGYLDDSSLNEKIYTEKGRKDEPAKKG